MIRMFKNMSLYLLHDPSTNLRSLGEAFFMAIASSALISGEIAFECFPDDIIIRVEKLLAFEI